MDKMKILGIETSCDETGIALIEASGGLSHPKFKVIQEFVASQIKIHRPFGGVVPNLAKREHLKNLPILLKKLLNSKSYILNSIDMIAVTVGPGLEPALWAGIEFAKKLGKKYKKPVIGANHLEGHLYSFLLPISYSHVLKNMRIRNIFPAIALIVSGGHTILLKMESLVKWEKLGETRDDAVGEAFDKVARILGLPYPGGPEIEKLALRSFNPIQDRQAQGKHPEGTINFPRPMMREKNYDFSFSGLKTSVLYYLRDNPLIAKSLKLKANVAASFQNAAIDVLVYKTARAAQMYGAKSIMLSGGVAANQLLRKTLQAKSYNLKANFLVADQKYNTDNAVMIAVAGYMSALRKSRPPKLEAQGDLGI